MKEINTGESVLPVKKRGGARVGGGRRKGSTQKLSAQTILAAIEDKDKPFAEGFAEDYHNARMGDDKHLLQKYQSMILNKVVADKQEIDVTTLGQSLNNNFVFPTKELSDWKEIPISYTVNE
jgi:hypothetical protein